MMIQTSSARATHYPNLGRYFFAELTAGKHSIAVSASAQEVRVILNNASHRAFGGMGRGFNSWAEAIEGYRTPAVRAMLVEAQRLDAEDRATWEGHRAAAVPA